MSAILAVYNRDDQPVDPAVVGRMLAAVPEHSVHGQDRWLSGPVALCHQHFWITQEEQGERQPLTHDTLGLTITADVRLDNRAELIQELVADQRRQTLLSDAQLILLAYVRWGDSCAEHLLGDFAFAIWDQPRRQMLLARDALGSRGLAYWSHGDVFCAATDISHLLGHPAYSPQINEAKIAEFLDIRFTDLQSTFYQDIYHCPPAHCLQVSAAGIRLWRYWRLEPVRQIRYRSDDEYAEHLRSLLAESVRCRLRSTGRVGISLSGGLDSSTLAAILAHVPTQAPNAGRIRSFSYVFDEYPSCDERPYIEQTVERLGLTPSYIVCDREWTLRDLDEWVVSRDFVGFDAFQRLPRAIAAAAREAGCNVLFSGLYGDSLFLGSRFWLLEMLQRGEWAQAITTLAAERDAVNWKQLAIDNGLVGLPPDSAKRAYRSLFRRVRKVRPYLTENLAALLAAPQACAAQPRRLPDEPNTVAVRRLGFNFALFAQGLSAGRRMYINHQMELALPYWDRRLIEFVSSLPADQLGTPKQDRRIVRNTMAPLLPAQVTLRQGRANFLPLMQRGIQDRERNTVDQLLHAPRIVDFGFVRKDWLRRAQGQIAQWGDDMEMLWMCISLELWLQRYW